MSKVKRITSHKQPVTVDGRTYITKVWVGRGEWVPDPDDPDDRTMPEVTRRYLSKAALVAAIKDGTAFIEKEEGMT